MRRSWVIDILIAALIFLVRKIRILIVYRAPHFQFWLDKRLIGKNYLDQYGSATEKFWPRILEAINTLKLQPYARAIAPKWALSSRPVRQYSDSVSNYLEIADNAVGTVFITTTAISRPRCFTV